MLKSPNCILAATLALLLIHPAELRSQTPPPAQPPKPAPQEPIFVQGPPKSTGIKIYVLEGEKAVNRLKDGTVITPVVEVRDSNDATVEGARVTFRLPAGGAGATFPGGSTERTFVTNPQGQAMAEGYTPNNLEGKFEIKVSATFREDKAEQVITQSNTFELASVAEKKKKNAWKKWVWIGGIAAGAAVALALVLTHDDGPGPPRVGVGVGPIVIGGN